MLLNDSQPDVVCRAVRVLAQARRQSAVPALVALLGHGHETVRRAAELGLLRFGPAAVRRCATPPPVPARTAASATRIC
ncbi:HEAT repeat domain-containing protein [Streptomyces zhihengii]